MVGGVEVTSSATIFVQWIILSDSGDREGTACTVEYKLHKADDSAENWTIAESDISITDRTRSLITGLMPYTEYDVRLQCDNEVGSSNVVEETAKTGVSCE